MWTDLLQIFSLYISFPFISATLYFLYTGFYEMHNCNGDDDIGLRGWRKGLTLIHPKGMWCEYSACLCSKLFMHNKSHPTLNILPKHSIFKEVKKNY